MPIVGPASNQGAGNLPPAPDQQNTSSSDEISQIVKTIGESDIDAFFVDRANPTAVKFDLNKVEMVINKYSTDSNNPQLYNKWLGLETTLTKALGKFSMDLKLLLNDVASMGQAQNMLSQQIPNGQGTDVATPSGQAQQQAPQGPESGKFGAHEKEIPPGEQV